MDIVREHVAHHIIQQWESRIWMVLMAVIVTEMTSRNSYVFSSADNALGLGANAFNSQTTLAFLHET